MRPGAHHFPYCSERCKLAAEAMEVIASGDSSTPSEVLEPTVHGALPPLDEDLELYLIWPTLPKPDELSEWDERWFSMPEHEKLRVFGPRGMRPFGVRLKPLSE